MELTHVFVDGESCLKAPVLKKLYLCNCLVQKMIST